MGFLPGRRATAALAFSLALIGVAAAGAQTLPAATPATPQPASSAAPTPVNPPENALVTDRVRGAFLAWQRGHINRRAYSPHAGGTYVDAYVAIVAPSLDIGVPQTVTYQTAALLLDDIVYRYDITGATGTISVLYALDQNGKTDNIVFTPQIYRAASPLH